MTLACAPTTDCAIQNIDMKLINKYLNIVALRNCIVLMRDKYFRVVLDGDHDCCLAVLRLMRL